MRKLICAMSVGALFAVGVCGIKEVSAAPVPATFCIDVGCNLTGAGCKKGALAGIFASCDCVPAPGPGAPFPTYCHYSEWF